MTEPPAGELGCGRRSLGTALLLRGGAAPLAPHRPPWSFRLVTRKVIKPLPGKKPSRAQCLPPRWPSPKPLRTFHPESDSFFYAFVGGIRLRKKIKTGEREKRPCAGSGGGELLPPACRTVAAIPRCCRASLKTPFAAQQYPQGPAARGFLPLVGRCFAKAQSFAPRPQLCLSPGSWQEDHLCGSPRHSLLPPPHCDALSCGDPEASLTFTSLLRSCWPEHNPQGRSQVEALGLEQSGSCLRGLGTNAEETGAAEAAARSHASSGSHSTDFLSGTFRAFMSPQTYQ